MAELTNDRVAQLTDDVTFTLWLPITTEEWADELLAEEYEVRRDPDGRLVVAETIGGNCNAVDCAQGFLSDVQDLLREGDVDPMGFVLVASSSPPEPDLPPVEPEEEDE